MYREGEEKTLYTPSGAYFPSLFLKRPATNKSILGLFVIHIHEWLSNENWHLVETKVQGL